MILENIAGPEDLKGLEMDQLTELAVEIRKEILKTVLANGGHLASSLGVVELTIALHYCFDMLHDRLIYDVGHQCYPHKILTGRRKDFHTLRKLDGLSGFPFPPESPYDLFHTGHAGTSVSLGSGVACWDKRNENNDRKVVVVIGDASLGAGVALEAINSARDRNRNMLIVLNDNEMSISRTVGAIAQYLNRVRMAPIYSKTKAELQTIISKLPLIGEKMDRGLSEISMTLKNMLVPGQIFEELGLAYYGPIDGHNLPLLVDTFAGLKKKKGVMLIHLLTKKGKGFELALDDPEAFHGVSPGSTERLTMAMEGAVNGVVEKKEGEPASKKVSYTEIFGQTAIELAEEKSDVVAITAAMPDGTGLKEFARRFPDRFHDTGITEQHAVAFAGGLSFAGAKPVAAIYSTFLQRCYDQVFQEVCLQNADVTLALDRGGVVGQDGPTHHGLYDIAYLRTLPQMTLLSPRDGEEFRAMLRFAVERKGPVAVRYPRAKAPSSPLPFKRPIEYGKGELLRDGLDALVVAYGSMVYPALEAAKRLSGDGIDVGVINARFAKPIDADLILDNARGKKAVITVEEHALAGGFGAAVAEELIDRGFRGRILRIGVPDRFVEHGTREELLHILGLTPEAIAGRILECIDEENQSSSRGRERAAVRDQEVL
jgi:1-deoxy-D-xylulose-5-phosphate synthase